MEPINDEFTTINNPGQSLFKDRGSKFYGYAFNANSEEQVKEHLSTIKAEHKQARHICYAYQLDTAGLTIRANDDGEPSHSAGTPILNQIKSAELVETIVAVVRYFGGTKLGVSGLINAYKTAAEEAIKQATTKIIYKTENVILSAPFDAINDVMRLTKLEGVKLVNQQYGNEVSITLNVRLSMMEHLSKELKELHRIKVDSEN